MNAMPTHRPRVLIVDDDPMMRLLVCQALEHSGMEVAQAEDGMEGIRMFGEQRPDIVLMDVNMPHVDGFTACRAIRQMPKGAHTPVLMLTSLDDAESIAQAYEAGATDFVTKPIAWPLLEHRVRYILRASRAIQDLARSRERLAEAQRIAGLGNWEWDLVDDTVLWSDEIYRICGLAADVKPALAAFLAVISPEDRERANDAIDALMRDGTACSLDHHIVTPTGNVRVVRTHGEATLDEEGKVTRLAGTVQDITARRRAEEQIRYLAYHDTLTGLPNRLWCKEMFARTQAGAQRNSRQMAMLCLDIDRFKIVNDTLGHSVGDLVLKEIAARLKGCLRESDPVTVNDERNNGTDIAHFGGDQFTIVLDDVAQVQDIAKLAQRLLEASALPITVDGHEVTVTASIGVAVYPNDGREFEELLKNAASAMYYAKGQGRNQFQFYTRSMNAAARDMLNLENRLRKALERQEFALHYQPKIDLRSGRVSGVEALLRWHDPEFGTVPPARFIPLAEETGLIVPIGTWVLETACRQAQAWQEAGHDLSMAVNFSARQFRQQDVPRLVRRVLDETGLETRRLELELTESVLMHDRKIVAETLRELKDMGIVLSLDDFGTGYSSLSYLRRFPIDIVKIDQSFIRDLSTSPDAAALTKAIISMAQSLGMKTIAEGVETREQLSFLSANKCDGVQGYLFSRPLPAQELSALLKAGGCAESAATLAWSSTTLAAA